MRKPLDLSNKKFGRLTAIDIAYKKNGVCYWNCICDCGNKTVVSSTNLKQGRIVSCGCYLRERYIETHRKYFGGEKVDRLTILEYDKEKVKYKCQCECGKIVYKNISTLQTIGAKYGCGCFLKNDPNDYVGKKFGMLTVISPAYHNKKWFYNCKCDCGNEKIVDRNSLKYKHTISCGCYAKTHFGKDNVIHGMTRTRIFRIWCGMKSRCYNENSKKYPNYGARGIIICDDWKNDFMAFYKWATNNGYSDNLSIDRIDVNGNYEPSNCRWSTNKEQANNRTTNKFITYNGETKTILEWADITGVNYYALIRRLKSGWSIEKAFNTPSRKELKRREII